MANGIYLIIIFHGFELSSECYQFQSEKNSLAEIAKYSIYSSCLQEKKLCFDSFLTLLREKNQYPTGNCCS